MTEDSLIIGYDNNGKDSATLVVARYLYPRMQFIKIFRDEEAQKIYELLTIDHSKPKEQHHLGLKCEQIIIDDWKGGSK